MTVKQYGVIIKADGTQELFVPQKTKAEYTEIRGVVDGMIAQMELKGGIMWVNDEFLINDSDYNPIASNLFRNNRKYTEQESFICGDVLFIPYKTWKGRDLITPLLPTTN